MPSPPEPEASKAPLRPEPGASPPRPPRPAAPGGSMLSRPIAPSGSAPPRTAASRRAVPPPDERSEDDAEAERLLTRANIQLRRGLTADAEAAVHSLLASHPQDAGAWELLADIRLSRSDLPGAREALKSSLQFQPGRATAETKLGRVALQISERERMRTLGMAYAGGEASLVRSGEGGGRGATWAAVASALIPGLGQYVNGEVVKGIVVASVYFVSLLLLALLPDTQTLLHSVAGTLAGGHARHGEHAGGGGALVGSALLALLMTADWIYGMVDAAQASRRGVAPPAKGGWQQ